MPRYDFYQVDVFTNQPFGGNPLAVFPDAAGLDAPSMQCIAREMNLSETTFVFPPTIGEANFRVRIFTPVNELPFAGHPVVGTHWTLARLGKIPLQEPVTVARFELGVGVRAAALHVQGGRVTKVVMDHQKPQFVSTASAEQIARLERVLGLSDQAIRATHWPVQVVSTGIRQLFVPIRSLADVQGISPAKLDTAGLMQLCAELDPETHATHGCVMVLSLETQSPAAQVHTRVFVPAMGIPEDPATGSASGGLGAYLVENRILAATPPTTRINAEQGIEMGRPSRIESEVDGTPGDISMIRVGGEVVPVIEGTVSW